MKMYCKILVSTLVFVAGLANAYVAREVDSFDGSVVLSSYIYEYDSTISYDNYVKSDLTGSFSLIKYYKKKTASGVIYNMLYLGLDSTRYSHIGHDTVASLKVDDSIFDLPRIPYLSAPSISSIYIYMDRVLPYILDGQIHEMTLRLSGPNGVFTLPISEPIKKEWARLSLIDFNDAALEGALPIGGSLYTVGKKITSWAYDPKNTFHKPILHIYRGDRPVKAIEASIKNCTTSAGNACAALVSQRNSWRTYGYEFNLEEVEGAGMDPIRVIAINSVAGQPAIELASSVMMLRDDIECVYNWAEKILPVEIISEPSVTVDEGVFRVRRYSNGSMLATVYGAGDFSFKIQGGPHTASGNLRDFLADAISQGCGSS